jgi:signal transduction histidine kinase/HAMP domain-containing protein
MSGRIRLQDLPLRVQLMWAFAFLSITTTAIATITLTHLSDKRMRTNLRERSERVARNLQHELQPVIAFDDHVSARELFDAYTGDQELDGMGVYAANGELIEGRGRYPATLTSINEEIGSIENHDVVLADIKSREGRLGHLYLSFSTGRIDALLRADRWIAAAIGASVVLCALLLAVQISRRIARRLVVIVEAANRMAAGDPDHAKLDDRAKDEIGALAHAFNVMVTELNRLSDEHDRLVLTERERLERLVSARTETLEQSREMFRLIAESTKAIPFTLDLTRGYFPYIGAQAIMDAGMPDDPTNEFSRLETLIPRASNPEIRQRFDECAAGPFEFEGTMLSPNGLRTEMRWTGTCEVTPDAKFMRGLMQNVTDLRSLERDLAAAQKLESVGRLAAGVAHEINTPVQFVSDNVQFVRTSMTDIIGVIQSYRKLLLAVQEGADATGAAEAVAATESSADLDYIVENAPPALDSAIDGLGRIATIVRSMKEFAHPDQAQKTAADLNQAIQSTLVIARNEYKYVADIDTEFGELPQVECYLGEINQVVLNLLVNAAQAIADVVKDSGNMGKLTVRTRLAGDEVEISISDTGTGIPEAVRDKIFDPFFTTKAIGKGTGQGLAIAHSVIVNKHRGSLRFETECGKGTTFFIRLPVAAPASDSGADLVAA